MIKFGTGNHSYPIRAPSAEEIKMSFLTPDSSQPQTTSPKPKKVGAPSGSVPVNKSASSRPDLVGLQFGSVKVISPEMQWIGPKWKQRMHCLCKCETCGRESWIGYGTLVAGLSRNCRPCNQPVRFPKWLYARVNGMVQRCRNPKNHRFMDYGGRGIEFRFGSVSEGCLWIQENLGLHQENQLDRIDNDGHYEAGNLRWLTSRQNASHTRRSRIAPLFHQFRAEHPEVRYADGTLSHLLGLGLTFEQIVERWAKPSCKPKGKYGTFSTADPVIASQQTDS